MGSLNCMEIVTWMTDCLFLKIYRATNVFKLAMPLLSMIFSFLTNYNNNCLHVKYMCNFINKKRTAELWSPNTEIMDAPREDPFFIYNI
jgi:hypothetical protein